MAKQGSLMRIRLEGGLIGRRRIPVDHLLRLLSQFEKVLARTGMVLQGSMDSVKRGPRSRTIKSELSLDLVAVTEGSLATVLELDRDPLQPGLPGIDFGMQVLERAISGLDEVQKSPVDTFPVGVDRGVLLAWRDLGVLFEKGVCEVRFTLNHRDKMIETYYSPNGFRRLQELIQSPRINTRTIEGRLLMADFKEHGTRCRVHPPTGNLYCAFSTRSSRMRCLKASSAT